MGINITQSTFCCLVMQYFNCDETKATQIIDGARASNTINDLYVLVSFKQ